VLPHLLERNHFPVVTNVLTVFAAGDYQHAATGGAAIGLDDKIVDVAKDLVEAPQLRMKRNPGIDLRRRHTEPRTQVAHAQLVVHDRKARAGIMVKNIRRIAAIHS
jgi:hypothetical protein